MIALGSRLAQAAVIDYNPTTGGDRSNHSGANFDSSLDAFGVYLPNVSATLLRVAKLEPDGKLELATTQGISTDHGYSWITCTGSNVGTFYPLSPAVHQLYNCHPDWATAISATTAVERTTTAAWLASEAVRTTRAR